MSSPKVAGSNLIGLPRPVKDFDVEQNLKHLARRLADAEAGSPSWSIAVSQTSTLGTITISLSDPNAMVSSVQFATLSPGATSWSSYATDSSAPYSQSVAREAGRMSAIAWRITWINAQGTTVVEEDSYPFTNTVAAVDPTTGQLDEGVETNGGGGVFVKAGVLDPNDLDSVPDSTTWKKTTLTEKTGAGYAYDGLEPGGFVQPDKVDTDAIQLGAVIASKIADGAVEVAKFASGLTPVEIVGALPGTGNYDGRVVFLTTDKKLYRYNATAGAFTAAVPTTDLSGTITSAQIADSAVGDAAINPSAAFAKVVQSKTQLSVSGGGTISWESTGGGTLAWTTRFISIPNALSSSGYIDFGPAAGGITIPAWNGLYYRHQIGEAYNHGNHALDGTGTGWFVAAYTTPYTPPDPTSGFVDFLIGVHNGDNSAFYLFDGRVIPMGKAIQGGLFIPDATIGNAMITDLHGDKITVNTLNADRIVSNSITAGQIQAGAIGAEEIAAGQIRAEHLFIGAPGGALNIDPGFEDSSAHALNNAALVQITDGKVGNGAVRSSTGLTGTAFEPRYIPIDHNKTYRPRAWVRRVGANSTIYLTVSLFDASFNNINGDGTYWYYWVLSVSPADGVWTEYVGSFGAGTSKTFPANARYMMLGPHIMNYVAASGYYEIQDARIEEVLPATLIQDGAITTDKIAANAITAGKIDTDAVTAAKIQAGAVTATKLSVGAASESRVLNPTFNDGFEQWSQVNMNLSSYGAGAYYAYSTAGLTGTLQTATPISAAPSQWVTLSMDIYVTNTNETLWLGMSEYNTAGGFTTSNPIIANDVTAGSLGVPAGTWTRISGQYPTRADTGSIRVYLSMNRTSIAGEYVAIKNIYCAPALRGAHIEDGAITAEKLTVTELSAIIADLGEVTAGLGRSSDSKFKVDFDNKLITIIDEQGSPITRIRIGELSTGAEDWGIEIKNSSGSTILTADGLGLSVVGRTNVSSGIARAVEDRVIQGPDADGLVAVTFATPFANTPTIILIPHSVQTYESTVGADQRLRLQASNITNTSFDLVAQLVQAATPTPAEDDFSSFNSLTAIGHTTEATLNPGGASGNTYTIKFNVSVTANGPVSGAVNVATLTVAIDTDDDPGGADSWVERATYTYEAQGEAPSTPDTQTWTGESKLVTVSGLGLSDKIRIRIKNFTYTRSVGGSFTVHGHVFTEDGTYGVNYSTSSGDTTASAIPLATDGVRFIAMETA